jgi:N-formylglutamate deformylase
MSPAWLTIERRDAPLILSIPHAGVGLLHYGSQFASEWLARRDADWHLAELYDFAAGLGATILRTSLSRSIIDVNRDPSGASLYPGQATTELCPTTSFDGEPLYVAGQAPDAREIDERRSRYFAPYHAALAAEIARLRAKWGRVAVYDAHSIRSRIPRLFDGELPLFNLGTNDGRACSPGLRESIAEILRASGESSVVDGRFKGGWITRSVGLPAEGVEAVQMELGCRAYMIEPEAVGPDNWPTALEPARANVTRRTLRAVLNAILAFASETSGGRR